MLVKYGAAIRDHSVFMVGTVLEIHQRVEQKCPGPICRIGEKCCCPISDGSQQSLCLVW